MRVKRVAYIAAVLVTTIVCFSTPAGASASSQFFGEVDSYKWREFNDNDKLIVSESGPLYTVGINYNTSGGRIKTKTTAELFTGKVAYNGSTWSGTPITTSTDYWGAGIETGIYQKRAENDHSGIFTVLGFKWWQRELESGTGSSGYLENWRTFYSKLGVTYEIGKTAVEAGIKLPLFSENRVDSFATTVKPENAPTYFVSANYHVSDDVTLSITYDTMRFGKSSVVYSPVLQQGIYQPHSQASTLGMRIAAKF